MEVSPGNLIDQLSIVNIKIFMLEDVKREKDASDHVVAEATRKTNLLNVYRNELISAIDEAFNKIAGVKYLTFGQNAKIYGSMRMDGPDNNCVSSSGLSENLSSDPSNF